MHNRDYLFRFVLVLVCFCEVFAKNVENQRLKRNAKGQSCDIVKPFFEIKNISVSSGETPKGYICGGHCCGPEAEAMLRKQSQKDFASLLQHNSRSLQGFLNSTATTLQNHISELARQSENKTLLLFSQIYQNMAVLSKDPISRFYGDIKQYVQLNASREAFPTTNIDIKLSVNAFFTDLFPLAYHHVISHPKDFTFEFKSCLRKTFSEIQPFGEIPRQISQSLSKSLDATRLLLQALDVGLEILNSTDALLTEDDGRSNAECHDALLKMTYCPRCLGMAGGARPCSGYCLNVLRGCLTRYVAELDSPWNGYVEAIERLVSAVKQHNNDAGVNADAVIKKLDTRISEAIMYAMEKGQDIDYRVKRTCGSAKFSDKEDPTPIDASTETSVGSSKPRLTKVRVFAPLPETELVHFLASIAKTRGFYANLADSLCQDESFAEPKDQHCWNGDRVGEYTKTVIAPGPDMQKYNPEVKHVTNHQIVNPRIANLADKLRHVHQMVMSSLGAAGLPEADNYMQGDGTDGSGSGSGPSDDADYESLNGSGSGVGSISDDEVGRSPPSTGQDPIRGRFNPPHEETPTVVHAGGSSTRNSVLVVAVVVFLSAFVRY